MGIKCEFDYCIYNEGFACVLEEIEMNGAGQCESCIIVSLPKEKLAEYKKTHLQEIISRYEDFEK